MSRYPTIAFRCDASIDIGTGHVMRCLALAHALTARGGVCVFVCRRSTGDLIDKVREEGYTVCILPDATATRSPPDGTPLAHAAWLPCDWRVDLAQTLDALQTSEPDWIVVDHYALDSRWEGGCRSLGIRVMVIDDLTDRKHECDLFLNQNLGAKAGDYSNLVPVNAQCLIGPSFALLRPEFAALRARTVARVQTNRWIACVGGLDKHRILEKILAAWDRLPAARPKLDVVVGASTPNLTSLACAIDSMQGVTLYAPATRFGDLMAAADMAICAGGTLNWERCCLGIPAIMGMVAENQRNLLRGLVRARTGVSIGAWQDVSVERLGELFARLRVRPGLIGKFAQRARRVVDGKGAERIASTLIR